MKVSDYIVRFFVEKGICDFFGYQGTMIAHFVDSIGRHERAVNHVCYNEQGAAFAACGYAQSLGRCGVAYATSGPGALNLLSGIANAYYDSIPVVFITGQINTNERHHIDQLRQDAFQETKTVEICKSITKYAVEITDVSQVRNELEKAYYIATNGRKGPVVLDIPMNIQRGEINLQQVKGYTPEEKSNEDRTSVLIELKMALGQAQRPVIVLGNGVARQEGSILLEFAQTLRIPIVTSLLGKGLIPYEHELNYGYLGSAYGHRYANMIVAGKSDLIIAVGCSLCTRQTGTKVNDFAPEAKVIRFDIDHLELMRKIKPDEHDFLMSVEDLTYILRENRTEWEGWHPCTPKWLEFCSRYKRFCEEFDQKISYGLPNQVMEVLNDWIQPGDIVACDVGQHMMWAAQSIKCKENMTFLFSGGHGAMGYALPAAIGGGVGEKERTIICICGDGALQMNIQELQWLKNEGLNMVVIVLNNNALGLIVQQQDAIFEKKYYGAKAPEFVSPNFSLIAQAYGIPTIQVNDLKQLDDALVTWGRKGAFLVEFMLYEPTNAYPKTVFGEKIYNQEPIIPPEILQKYLDERIEE